MTAAYTALAARFRRLALLGEANGVLQWDMAAVMPEGGAAIRGEQLAELKVIAHETLTAPEIADLLDSAARLAYAVGSPDTAGRYAQKVDPRPDGERVR